MTARVWVCVLATASMGLIAPGALAADAAPSATPPAPSGVPSVSSGSHTRAPKDRRARRAEPKHDPDNVTALSEYMGALVMANRKYAARDVAGALEGYRVALLLAPKNPLGPYFAAEAQLALGNVAEAAVALEQAEALSDDRNPGLRGKILFFLADVRERQKKWNEAKAAWQAFLDYAQKHAEVPFAASATSRVQAIDAMLAQDKAYETVRERIAQEKAEKAAAVSAPAAPAPRK